MKRHLSLGLIVAVAITATVTAFSSVAMAATPQSCYTFTRVNMENGAVISMITQPVPFVAMYDGGSALLATDIFANAVLTTTNQPGVFYAGFNPVLNRSTIGFGFEGGQGPPAGNYLPGYSKYLLESAGDCAAPTIPQINRVGMCSNIPVARFTGGLGHFLDLVSGQSLVGVTLTPAIFVQGLGLMCSQSEIATYGGNPAVYRATGTTVGGSGAPGSGYAYYARI